MRSLFNMYVSFQSIIIIEEIGFKKKQQFIWNLI